MLKFIAIAIVSSLFVACGGGSETSATSTAGSDNTSMNGSNQAASGTTYATNGQTIYMTGKNQKGDVLQDLNASQMKELHGCVNCHTASGKGQGRAPSNTYADLTNPARAYPYTDALIKRFLNEEKKSDGTPANTGVVWRMSEQDQDDLISYLKTLN